MSKETRKIEELKWENEILNTLKDMSSKKIHHAINQTNDAKMETKAKKIIISQMREKIAELYEIIEDLEFKLKQKI